MLSFRTLTVLSLVSAAGCGKLPGFSVNAKSDSFQQASERNDKIDVLFIVDNSGSMSQEQTTLANSFSGFINHFVAKGLNYHIGATTTDSYSSGAATSYWTSTGGYSTGPYRFYSSDTTYGSLLARIGNDRYLTSSSVNPVTQFINNVNFGITGSGAESGLKVATKFFSPAKLSGWNAGFLREDAFLAIILVSDEDESVGDTNDTYVKNVTVNATNTAARNTRAARVDDFLAAVRATKSTENQSRIRFDAVVAPGLSQCPSQLGADATGTVYNQVAATLGGNSADICQDFTSAIDDLGADLVIATTRFKLVQPPVGGASGISVQVNGVAIPQDANDGWTYLSDTHEIEFHGSAIPATGAAISVYYTPERPV